MIHPCEFWSQGIQRHKHPHLSSKITVDVAIIGAGMTGLTCAYELKKAGLNVAVIDMGSVAAGESGHTTAHLTEIVDARYSGISRKFNFEAARLIQQESRSAIDYIESTAEVLGISNSIKRVPGYLYAESSDQLSNLDSEFRACLDLDLPVQMLKSLPLPFSVEAAMRIENQARLQPVAYLSALAQAISGDGSYVFEHTRMLDIEEDEPCLVRTSLGEIRARSVVVATNVPVNNRFFIHTKVAAYRTYAIAAKLKAEPKQDALYWDLDDPYHYIRKAEGFGQELLYIIGGEDHKTGTIEHTDAAFMRLENYIESLFGIEAMQSRWSGQIIEPADGLPYIGLNAMSNHVYIATGYSGQGMTFGTMAGRLLCDLITGQENQLAECVNARRMHVRASFKTFVGENADYPYHLISDPLRKSKQQNETSVSELPKNSGQVMKVNGEFIAAYRDENGEMSALSAVCPHLGCLVAWNDAEKSWDCPCHGSRFTCRGEVLNGPALSNLDQRPTTIKKSA